MRKRRIQSGRRQLSVENRGKQIEMLNRMARCRELLLKQPHMTQTEMGVVLGVSQSIVSKYVHMILEEWTAEAISTTRERIELYVKRAEQGASEAFNGWQRSQKNQEVVTTAYVPKECPGCGGEKVKKGKECRTCDGTGKVIEEQVTRKEMGQAGDPALLLRYHEFNRDAARLRGLYARLNKRKEKPPSESGVQLHLHTDYDFSKMSGDEILRIKNALDQVKIAGQRTIDVRSKE